MKWKDKRIWVIGANSDIARAFMRAHAGDFREAVLASRDTEALSVFAAGLPAGPVRVAPLDIADAASRAAFLEKEETPDAILLCAGHIRYDGAEEDVSEENLLRTVDVNFRGPAAFLEAAAPRLAERGGVVLALTSCAGERGKASNRVYAAAKAGLTTYLEGFMQKYESAGVRTVIVKPGHVDTKMSAAAPGDGLAFSCSAAAAAERLWRALCRERSCVCVFPGIWRPLTFVFKRIPLPVYRKLKF